MLHAQQKGVDRSKELKIRENIPIMNLIPILNDKIDRINLNDSEDKVIILDFFDTFCATCIATMPKLQKLQDQMKDKLKIVMVSWQDQATMKQFYRTNSFLKKNKVAMPTIYSDTILRKYFPHLGVPHVAWLYKGKVEAITHSDFVDETNVLLLFKNGQISLPRKNDFPQPDRKDKVESPSLRSLGDVKLTGFKDAVPVGGFIYELNSLSGMHKTSFYNKSVFAAYTAVLSKIRKPEFLLKPERIVWEVPDSADYKYMEESGKSQVWLAKHGICYERTDALTRTEKEQAMIVLDDLNRFLGLKVYWSTKLMPCLIIHSVGAKKQKIITQIDGENGIKGTGVLAFMLDYSGKYPPAVDAVNSKEVLKLGDYRNIKELNVQLAPYGIGVKEGVKELEVLVFEKVNGTIRD